MVALGAATGAKLWNIAVADTTGSGEQMARLAANDPLHQQAETGATGVGIAMAPQVVDEVLPHVASEFGSERAGYQLPHQRPPVCGGGSGWQRAVRHRARPTLTAFALP